MNLTLKNIAQHVLSIGLIVLTMHLSCPIENLHFNFASDAVELAVELGENGEEENLDEEDFVLFDSFMLTFMPTAPNSLLILGLHEELHVLNIPTPPPEFHLA